MKTLYVSDLDGTLLGADSKISARSAELLNRTISQGALFTIATARTPATVAPILSGIRMNIPAIVMTGAAIWNPSTGAYSHRRFISSEAARELADIYLHTSTPTFFFTLPESTIHIYHIGGEMTALQKEFMAERLYNPYKKFHISELGEAEPLPDSLAHTILLYTMLPDAKAASTYELTRSISGVRAQYYHDIYGPSIGILEAFSDQATKANAISELARKLGADRIVAFGDNINDLPMLARADVAVAVANALPEVKDAAHIVIGPNTDDAVARFIAADFASQQQHSTLLP